jgi:hypothetical protein
MNKKWGLRISTAIFLVLTLMINGLSNTDLFPNTVREISDKRALLFLPDGYVFAIWGLIYTGLIGYAIYQMRPVALENGVVDRVGFWFIINLIANSLWIIVFVNDIVWISTILIITMLITQLIIYNRLEIGKRKIDWQERWAVQIPFSVYTGWVTVATVANISTQLYSWGNVTSFIGINADIWAGILLVIAGGIGIAFLYFRRDIAYALVVVWATYGIYARPFDTDFYQETIFDVASNLNAAIVNTTALSIAIVTAVAVGLSIIMQRRSHAA